LPERWLGSRFDLPAATFFQVNPGAAELLGARVLDACGPASERSVADLYGGVGAYGRALARGGDRVHVVEADRDAVDCGRRARSDPPPAGRSVTRGGGRGRDAAAEPAFECADVAAWLASPERAPVDLVVANPPRGGFARSVPSGIARLHPRRVVLVSCDPATLARDARRLIDAGFVLRSVRPVDLFPQTPHVETVSVFERA
jgi:23S rRNA (uracil1939-C5)-methyltransferase